MDFFDSEDEKKLPVFWISVIFNIILLIGCIYFFYQSKDDTEVKTNALSMVSEDSDNSKDIEDTEIKNFYVEIKGAVSKPGVYEVNSNNIVNDVIIRAGGFNEDAYTDNINLSKKLTSELVIYVYTQSEYASKNNPQDNTICNCPSYDISDCLDSYKSEISSDDDNSNKDVNEIININTASKEELMMLNGIGSIKADDIINYRNINGNFNSIEEIKNVSGISDAIFNKIKDYITV